jgi:Protein of unknown function (DUF1634)
VGLDRPDRRRDRERDAGRHWLPDRLGRGLERLAGWGGPGEDPTDFSGVLAGIGALRPIAIAQAGLLVLVATPVSRVAVSLVAFLLERDRLYAAITAAVLGLLLFSLLVVR